MTATMLASGWTGSEAPFVYTLAIAGVTATSYQELLPAVNITAEQLKALQAANITDAGQAAGTMTLKAYGKSPPWTSPSVSSRRESKEMPTIIRFGGGAGDGAQKLVVNVDSGAAVTAKKGSYAVSAVSENGQAVLELDEAGTSP